MATLVVKGTFLLAGELGVTLATSQEDLRDDEAQERAPRDELNYASDFVPHKRRPEFLVGGFAFSPVPGQKVDVEIEVGDRRRSVVALMGGSETATPLVSSALRGGESERVCVGPRLGYTTRTELEPSELRAERAFQFNAAPVEQQLDSLSEDSAIRLRGTLPGGASCSSRLPGLRPTVFLVPKGSVSAARTISLTCDTLFIDASKLVCSVVWRGSVEASALEGALIVSVVSFHHAPPAWSDIEWQLRHAARELAEERTIARAEPTELDRSLAPAVLSVPAPTTSLYETTANMTVSPLSSRALPFQASDAPASSPIGPDHELPRNDTAELPLGPAPMSLPFRVESR